MILCINERRASGACVADPFVRAKGAISGSIHSPYPNGRKQQAVSTEHQLCAEALYLSISSWTRLYLGRKLPLYRKSRYLQRSGVLGDLRSFHPSITDQLLSKPHAQKGSYGTRDSNTPLRCDKILSAPHTKANSEATRKSRKNLLHVHLVDVPPVFRFLNRIIDRLLHRCKIRIYATTALIR